MSKISDTRLELIPIMKELIKREPIFHRLEFGTSRAALETMTHDEFWEVGVQVTNTHGKILLIPY